MNNFGRTVRLALQTRWTFAASVFCALMIAVLWGGNIGTVYPVAEVTFRGKSMKDWAHQRVADLITQGENDLAERTAARNAARATPALPGVAPRLAEAEKQADQTAWELSKYLWLQDRVIDPYLPSDPFNTLLLMLGILVVGTTIKSLFMIGHAILVSQLSHRATLYLRNVFYRRTLDMEIARFTADGTSDLMNRFTSDMESLAAGLNELFGKLVREPLKMIVCLVGAACICWRLLLVSLVLAPAAALAIRWLAKALKRANRRAMEEMSAMYNTLEETFQGIKVVKAFTMERQERRRFLENSRKYFNKQMRIARYDSLTRPLIEMIGVLTICLALLAGAYLTINQETHLLGVRMTYEPLSLSSLLLFYGLLAGMSDPARKLSEVFSRIQRGAAAGDRIFQLIDRAPGIVDPPKCKPLSRHHRELAFEGVDFHYHSSQPVLEHIDLRIPHGETVAIVGPNGCGKSTLANLVPRFFDPVRGAVTIDGVDLRGVRMKDIRRQIGLVTQETLLFDDSVYDNIRYGSPQATREQVVEAARQAHAHRFIEENLTDGYETVVGARGARISGGQRQRIALARAILRDPAILILDEATSQIDLESEQVIHQVLEKFVRDRTTIIITHRMSTLALADRIVVMNAGRILDVGTHDKLLQRCELYGRLYDIQFKEIA